MHRRSLPPRFMDARLENLDRAFNVVRYYFDNLQTMVPSGHGLLLAGNPGVGKTYALAALTNAAAKGHVYRAPTGEKRLARLNDWCFVTGPHLFEHYVPYDFETEDYTELFETVPWLIINDLSKEDRAGKMEKQITYKLGRLLRARVEAQLVTHITTNARIEVKPQYPMTSLQEIYGDSIFSLMCQACPYPLKVEVVGEDRRRKRAEELLLTSNTIPR